MDFVKDFFRPFFPQWVVNRFYHLPRAFLANIFYDFPTRGMKIVGVTGTDGKTTTVNMIYQILVSAGKKVSMVSTINAPGLHVTSPDPFMVQKFAKQAKESGDEYLVLEVTSHALDQYRFWGINFDVAVITNITHEHLDYHGTWENYFQTKVKLIKNVKIAVLNSANLTHGMCKVITFGLTKSADFNPKNFPLKLKIPGDYNILNGLAASAVCSGLGVDSNTIQTSLSAFHGLVGRMQEVKNRKGIKIIIDFAHTPNALEQALKTLRNQTKGRLIAVFGSAGKRDVGKRELMGQVAGELADIVVVTTEDPRGEWEVISRQIISGAKKLNKIRGKNLFVVEDRGEAISFAINNLARKGDLVGIFGKGHEESMNLDGKREIPWSDFEAVEQALNG